MVEVDVDVNDDLGRNGTERVIKRTPGQEDAKKEEVYCKGNLPE